MNMGLRDIGATLPPGFRFYPSDEELVCHYLYKKIANEEALKGTLVEIDLHTCEPWQLPEVAKLNANEWYFFSFRDRKYATGFRTNRATTSGYWKATGKDRTVLDPTTRELVGMRKTLVFYRNRAPNGIKTGWIMHEFRLETPHMPPKEDWVLCRVFHKSKGENGAKLSPQFIFDSTATANNNASILSMNSSTASPPIVTVPFGYQPVSSTPSYHNHNSSNSMLNLLQFSSLEKNSSDDQIPDDITSKNDVFFWDMELQANLGDGLEDMRFDQTENSMVFL
ncbi:NAC domain protein [Melia azedarach]|uniref:NAC domain protein n=1 Tax=Melia azedarach TaxID=155640 RepID=A0ACC1YTV9_MELAZ|nr:NAC domain protein [Melia azedarach]